MCAFNPAVLSMSAIRFLCLKTVEEYRAECFIVHAFLKLTTNMRGLRQWWYLGDELALTRYSKPCRHQTFSLTARLASIALGDCAKVGT